MKKVLGSLVLAAVVVTGCNTQTSKDAGKEGKDLALTAPKEVAIDRDAAADLKITIDRKGFEDAVMVKITGLPKGVSCDEDGKLDKGVKERTFKLKAAADASLGKGTMKLTASGGGMERTLDVAFEVRDPLAKEAGEDLKKKRDALSAAIQTRMKEIDRSMDELRSYAKTADAKAKAEINNQLAALEKHRQKLDADFQNVRTTSAEVWQDYSTRLTNAANELHKGVAEAVKKLRKE